jgi:thiol-disulfide isomerase/thioredoxin
MNVKKCVRALLCLYLTLIIAMDAVKAQALKVGDTLPPELWSMPLQVINHPEGKETLTLSEYKDKLIILDFWATWCSPCIAMLPKQDSLQKKFKDQLQILPVTYQTGEEVSTFMEKFNRRMKYKNALPKVVADEGLHKAFPHRYLPHYVWIDAGGTVKAITGYQDINAEKITTFLKSEQITLTTKEDPTRIPFDRRQPYLVNGNGSNGQTLLYHSLLTGHTEGLGSRFSMQVDSLGFGNLLFLNSTLYWLYKMAYGADSLWFGDNRVEINLSNRETFHYNQSFGAFGDWNKKNAVCYQLLLSKTTRNNLFKTLSEDLERNFPEIRAAIEQREKMCWVLSRIPGGNVPYSRSQNRESKIEPDGYSLKNAPIKSFVAHMNRVTLQLSPLPLLDETGITSALDMRLKSNLNNMEELAAELEQYGFRLTEECRTISVLVISDNPAKL